MIVRMADFVLPALPSQQLDRAIRDHLVRVHVERDARPGLVNVHNELIVQFAGNHLFGRLNDRSRPFPVDEPQFAIRRRRRLLDHPDRLDQFRVRPIAADREILQRPRRLNAVIHVRRNRLLAQRILLHPCLHLNCSRVMKWKPCRRSSAGQGHPRGSAGATRRVARFREPHSSPFRSGRGEPSARNSKCNGNRELSDGRRADACAHTAAHTPPCSPETPRSRPTATAPVGNPVRPPRAGSEG